MTNKSPEGRQDRPAPQSRDVANYLDKKGRLESRGTRKFALSEIQELPSYLFEITDRLKEISGTWDPVTFYTATNHDDEKTRFIAAFKHGEVYNPAFEYGNAEIDGLDEKRAKIEKLMSQVRDPQLGNPDAENVGGGRLERLARAALYYKLRDDLATTELVEALKNGDEKQIKRALRTKYPGLTKRDKDGNIIENEFLLNLARQSYEYYTSKDMAEEAGRRAELSEEELKFMNEPEKFGAEDIKEAISWMLNEYGVLHTPDNLDGIPVIITDKVAGITVSDKRDGGTAVLIPKTRRISGRIMLYNMSHEVEGHALQSLNGQKLFNGLGGGALKVDDEMLYEGLGMRYQTKVLSELFGEPTPMPKPYYIYATKAAEEGKSFHEIYSQIFDMYFHERLKIQPDTPLPDLTEVDEKEYEHVLNEAWRLTYRVMRGHADATNPESFAMSKDLVYMNGWALDQELVENGIGYLNESGIIASGALQLLAELDIHESDLSIQYRNLTREYWYKILKPKYFPD